MIGAPAGDRQEARDSSLRRDAVSFWNGEASAYDAGRERDWSFRDQLREVIAAIPRGGARLLEIGCGAGHALSVISHAMPAWTCGCDLSLDMLRAARHRAGARDAVREPALVQADCVRLPFADRSFDCVVAMGVMEYIEDLTAMGREVSRVLNPGGLVVLTVPNTASPYKALRNLTVDMYRGLRGVAQRSSPQAGISGDRPRRAPLSFWSDTVAGWGFALVESRPICPQVVAYPLDEMIAPLGRAGSAVGRAAQQVLPPLGTVCFIVARKPTPDAADAPRQPRGPGGGTPHGDR